MPFVYSTLSADVSYNVYYPVDAQIKAGVRTIQKSILIKGGSGVAPLGKRALATQFGIVTEVTDEELEILKNDETFKTHLTHGFVSYASSKVDPEKIIVDMELRDDSSPIMPEDNLEGDTFANNANSEFDTNVSIPSKKRSKELVNKIQ